MSQSARSLSSIEPLEARIAPAVIINNHLPDLLVGIGKTSTSFDLGQLTAVASSSAYHTKVQFITNYDTNSALAGIQAGIIELELYDDQAPLTVQNFLAYVNNANLKGDYDGTLFHRAIAGFVLQGGGYEAATPGLHIPTFPFVHNEANPTNRSNVSGTITMAKLGGDPNSASSEWFINLADNSTNLDAQNGGFTVFGKVTGNGLALATQIANLQQINVDQTNGGGTPVQNGVSIKVVGAKVVPATAAPATGLTYTVDSITTNGATPANLVTTKITGSKLTVNYTPGLSGEVNITVKATDGVTSAIDTFEVAIRPNFAGSTLVGDTLPKLLVPGDSGVVKVNVGNSGGSIGGGTVEVTLVKLNVTKNSAGRISNYTDDATVTPLSIGSSAFQLASGKKQDVSVSVSLSNSPFGNGDNYYRVVTKVVPKDTPLVEEQIFTDDDAVTGTTLHNAVNKFGTITDLDFGSRVTTLKYLGESTDGKPALVTWTMKGPGSGTIAFDAQGKDISLTTQGTTFASTVTPTLTKNSSRLSLSRIDFADALGTATLGLVDLNGPLTASGGLKLLTLGDVTGQALFSIGAPISLPTTKATLTLGNVTDLSLETEQSLAALTVAKWLDTDSNNDSISAPSLGKLLVKGTGNFEADLTLTDSAVPLTSVVVGGFLRNATIQTAGDIGAVKLGGIAQSNVFAGVTSRPTSFPASDDPHKITSFTIAGGVGLTTPLFTNSQVAAQTISTIKVRDVGPTVAAGTAASGFVADVIGSYARPGGPTKTQVTAPGVFDDEADGLNGGYVVTVL